MVDELKVITTRRQLAARGEVSWGGDGQQWGEAIATNSGVTVSDQGIQPDTASAIPDSGMFQSPIYQFWAGEIDQSDGSSPVPFPEVLSGLDDATAVGGPTFRSDQFGFEAAEYDGADDAHDWSSDSQIPTDNDSFSWAATIYLSGSSLNVIASYGDNTYNGYKNEIDVNAVDELQHQFYGQGSVTTSTDTVPTDEWATVGASWDGSTLQLYINGSADNSNDPSEFGNVADTNHSIGYERQASNGHFDGYIREVIISDTTENDQAFADYHNDRI